MSLQDCRIAFVGAGVMAEAMIGGLLATDEVGPDQIVASDPRADRRAELARTRQIQMVESNVAAVADAQIVVLAIKPQVLAAVGRELASALAPDQLAISIVAGASIGALRRLLSHDRLVRTMPNTPAQIGRGVTAWYATPEVSELQRSQTRQLLASLGAEVTVHDERSVAMATAVSGSGPAYLFLVAEALIDAAVEIGFARPVAERLVIEMLDGSAAFAKATGTHPALLRNMVTSPGGTTAAAIRELEAGRLRAVLSDAVGAAFRRTEELGRQLEEELDRQPDATP